MSYTKSQEEYEAGAKAADEASHTFPGMHIEAGTEPWVLIPVFAQELRDALLEWAWREGSCHSDWSPHALRLQALHKQAEQLVAEIEATYFQRDLDNIGDHNND